MTAVRWNNSYRANTAPGFIEPDPCMTTPTVISKVTAFHWPETRQTPVHLYIRSYDLVASTGKGRQIVVALPSSDRSDVNCRLVQRVLHLGEGRGQLGAQALHNSDDGNRDASALVSSWITVANRPS